MQKIKRRTSTGAAGSNRGQSALRQARHGRIKRIWNMLRHRAAAVFHINKENRTQGSAVTGSRTVRFAGIKRWFRQKPKQRIILCAGSLVVAAVVLIVILVPSAQASINPESVAEHAGAIVAMPDAPTPTSADRAHVASAPTQTALPPIETTSPEVTQPVPTTTEVPDSTPEPEPVVTTAPDPTPEPEPVVTTAPDPTTTPIDIDELVAAFKVEADDYYNDMHYSSNFYEYTEEEWFVLAQVIDGEAGSQPWDGKVAVGNVVMNRVLASGYPGSDIITVVTTAGQFSGYFADNVPNSESKKAARAVLDDQLWTVPQHSFNFNSHKPEGEDWGSGSKKHSFWKKIGNHNFYVDQDFNRGRCQRTSVPPALFKRTFKWPQYGCKPSDRVYRVQAMLNALEYDVSADKYFGKGTKDALKQFQSDKGLDADGVAGPATLEALIEAYGLTDYYHDFCE